MSDPLLECVLDSPNLAAYEAGAFPGTVTGRRFVEAFRKFAAQFHQDVGVIHKTLEAAVEDALSALTESEKDELRGFLERFRNDEGPNFKSAWNRTDAAMGISNEKSGRKFVSLTLRLLD